MFILTGETSWSQSFIRDSGSRSWRCLISAWYLNIWLLESGTQVTCYQCSKGVQLMLVHSITMRKGYAQSLYFAQISDYLQMGNVWTI